MSPIPFSHRGRLYGYSVRLLISCLIGRLFSHGGAGTGRSGVFAAILIAQKMLLDGRHLTVSSVVKEVCFYLLIPIAVLDTRAKDGRG